MAHVVRLFLDHDLRQGEHVVLGKDQAHRLFHVMRKREGDLCRVFNGRDGEWEAKVIAQAKRNGTLQITKKTANVRPPPDLWLLFAPIKKERTDFIVEKAAELGAARICPVLTDFTNSERVRIDRLQTHAISAIEQCGGTWVPEVAQPQKLSTLLDTWPEARSLLFCDETAPPGTVFPNAISAPCAILIGPEGGFSHAERSALGKIGHTVSLGPRILRADTACVAALSIWQASMGDW